MAPGQESPYQCTLSKSSLEKARKELGENPDTRMLEVNQLRKRLDKVPGLKARTDTKTLVGYLRGRKFDQERTYKMIMHHYQERFDHPDLYQDIKPSAIRHFIDDGLVEVLKERDNQGCCVVIFRVGKWDPDRNPITQCIKLIYLLFSKLAQDEENQVHGIRIIDIMDGMTMKHATSISPANSKIFAGLLQEMFPLRLKRYDFVNEPTFFDLVFPIFKAFMKEKLIQRLHLNGSNLEEIHKTMSPEFLPTDLGGKREPYFNNKEWISEFLASEKEFEEDNKFGFLNMGVANRKSETSQQDAGLQGLGGTFKKLEL